MKKYLLKNKKKVIVAIIIAFFAHYTFFMQVYLGYYESPGVDRYGIWIVSLLVLVSAGPWLVLPHALFDAWGLLSNDIPQISQYIVALTSTVIVIPYYYLILLLVEKIIYKLGFLWKKYAKRK